MNSVCCIGKGEETVKLALTLQVSEVDCISDVRHKQEQAFVQPRLQHMSACRDFGHGGHAATRSPGLRYNVLHPRNLCNYMD